MGMLVEIFLSNCISGPIHVWPPFRLPLYNIQSHYKSATTANLPMCEIERNWTSLKSQKCLSLILYESGNTSESKSLELLWMGPEIDFEKKW